MNETVKTKKVGDNCLELKGWQMMKDALFSLIACLMLQLTGFAATEQDTKDIDEVKQEAPVKAPRMESTPLVPKEEKTMTTTADEGPDATKEEIARSHAQMMEKMKEMQAKFDALTDEQKKEIYDLYDKINVRYTYISKIF